MRINLFRCDCCKGEFKSLPYLHENKIDELCKECYEFSKANQLQRINNINQISVNIETLKQKFMKHLKTKTGIDLTQQPFLYGDYPMDFSYQHICDELLEFITKEYKVIKNRTIIL